MPAPHQKNKLHPQDQKNLLLFAALFGVVYLLFDGFILQPHMQKMGVYHDQVVQETAAKEAGFIEPDFYPREDILPKSNRAFFNHQSLSGSVTLEGGRIDDVSLRNYFETLDKKKQIAILSPEKTEFPRYAEFGWLRSDGSKDLLPDAQTVWQVKSQSPEKLTIMWQSPSGVIFERDIEVTKDFLVKVTQRIINPTPTAQTLYPYALITEHGQPSHLLHRWIVHEGPVGFINQQLQERQYAEMSDNPVDTIDSTKGWVGFTEHYWLAALLPEQEQQKSFRFAYRPSDTDDKTKSFYQVDVRGDAQTISAGQTQEYVSYLFTGAKQLKTLQTYGKELGIEGFDAAIDFGWFWFLTKPFLTVIIMINSVVGHFATTMLIFAFLLRLCIFPLASTSYRSFAKLRIITPRIMELKDQYKEDKAGMQKALIELYQREKVNPAAGCLPILIQIPIFFSLYKVLNVAIEMRHAPGFFWINDLSAPDPTSLLNLFGLLPFDVPHFYGAWPCLMVLTLLIQKSMNPPPTDQVMRDVFAFMPFIMGFVMSNFAAGLIIYWTFTNILSALQQYTIMRMMGVDVKLFQGWFGREYKQNDPDIHKLGFSEETIEFHKNRKNKTDTDQTEVEESDFSEEDTPEVTPPKPRRKKKK